MLRTYPTCEKTLTVVCHLQVPKQQNSSDCGLWAIHFVDRLFGDIYTVSEQCLGIRPSQGAQRDKLWMPNLVQSKRQTMIEEISLLAASQKREGFVTQTQTYGRSLLPPAVPPSSAGMDVVEAVSIDAQDGNTSAASTSALVTPPSRLPPTIRASQPICSNTHIPRRSQKRQPDVRSSDGPRDLFGPLSPPPHPSSLRAPSSPSWQVTPTIGSPVLWGWRTPSPRSLSPHPPPQSDTAPKAQSSFSHVPRTAAPRQLGVASTVVPDVPLPLLDRNECFQLTSLPTWVDLPQSDTDSAIVYGEWYVLEIWTTPSHGKENIFRWFSHHPIGKMGLLAARVWHEPPPFTEVFVTLLFKCPHRRREAQKVLELEHYETRYFSNALAMNIPMHFSFVIRQDFIDAVFDDVNLDRTFRLALLAAGPSVKSVAPGIREFWAQVPKGVKTSEMVKTLGKWESDMFHLEKYPFAPCASKVERMAREVSLSPSWVYSRLSEDESFDAKRLCIIMGEHASYDRRSSTRLTTRAPKRAFSHPLAPASVLSPPSTLLRRLSRDASDLPQARVRSIKAKTEEVKYDPKDWTWIIVCWI